MIIIAKSSANLSKYTIWRRAALFLWTLFPLASARSPCDTGRYESFQLNIDKLQFLPIFISAVPILCNRVQNAPIKSQT